MISDPHGKHGFLDIPENVDMVLCAGDISNQKNPALNANEVLDFLEWYKSLVHIPYKLFCPGNHDTSIQAGLIKRSDIDKSLIYIEHESVVIEGIKIFMSPYTPSFGTGWAYNIPRGKLAEYWKDIPADTDILVTHGPPKGILDLTQYDSRDGADGQSYFQCGCKSLLNRIHEIKPRYHMFGHIHPESNCPNSAMLKINGLETTFMNAAVVNLRYEIVNNGFIIDIEPKK